MFFFEREVSNGLAAALNPSGGTRYMSDPKDERNYNPVLEIYTEDL
jgi:hypothetical protein